MNQFPFSGPPQRLTNHRFLNLFTSDIHTETNRQPWIFASRKETPSSGPITADAVAMIVVVDRGGEPCLAVIREFRAPLGCHELALPSGLIDKGETASAAASRELFEETGLTLTKVVHVSPPLASSAGVTDETIRLVYARATGTISKAHLGPHEQIDARLMNFSEIKALIQNPSNDVPSVRLYAVAIGLLAAGKIALPATEESVTTLYRPVGPEELELIKESGFLLFPPRLPGQPIFYPVLNEAYAVQIARDWNVPSSGAGFVTRFQVRSDFVAKYPAQIVGSKTHHAELWVPAEELSQFNRNIVGHIEVIAEFKKPPTTAG